MLTVTVTVTVQERKNYSKHHGAMPKHKNKRKTISDKLSKSYGPSNSKYLLEQLIQILTIFFFTKLKLTKKINLLNF